MRNGVRFGGSFLLLLLFVYYEMIGNLAFEVYGGCRGRGSIEGYSSS